MVGYFLGVETQWLAKLTHKRGPKWRSYGKVDLIELKEDLSNQQSCPNVECPAVESGEFLKHGCIREVADEFI